MYGTDNLQQYVGKKIIASLSYNENYDGEENTICYVFPQCYLDQNNQWQIVPKDDFLSYGSIAVHLVDRQDAGDFVRNKGNLVVVTINKGDNDSHLFPKQDRNGKYCYHMGYSPRKGKNQSQIWIESFAERNFYQLVPSNCPYSELSATKLLRYFGSIYTPEILVLCEGYYYGPFTYEKKQDSYISVGSKSGNDLYQYVAKYDKDSIEDERYDICDFNRNIICSIIASANVSNQKKQEVDWLSDKELINGFCEVLSACQLPAQEIESFKKFLQTEKNNITSERQKRLNDIIDKALKSKEFARSAVEFILADEDLKENFFQVLPEDGEYIQNNISFKKLKNEKEALINSNESLLEDNKKLREQFNNYVPDTNSKELKEEIEKLKAENTKLLGLNNDISKLEQQKNKLEEQNNTLQQNCAEYQNKLDIVKTSIADSVSQLKNEATIISKQIDTKLLKDVLDTISSTQSTHNHTSFDSKLLVDLSAEQIIERVNDYFYNIGRPLTRNDIINYLICISQGFITTFAGEPGTGKTSLCNHLSKALGLSRDDDNNRFAEISVERGWNSIKDFIGYYNPLTNKVEQSNTEAFNALAIIDKEADTQGSYAPYFMLLDEANLSPLEHYWANFLRLCDENSTTSRKLNLGGTLNYKIPTHLKFLATVNFDHTTEELSPRFLDRSWVITLKTSPNITATENTQADTAENVVSYNSLVKAFNHNDNSLEQSDVFYQNNEKWKKLQRIFADCHKIITPRNQIMINNYIKTASQYMELQGNNRYIPLDYAFSQKILPLINGNGETYNKLIDLLLEETSELTQTQEHLERIKRLAEQNMDFYQFFAK